MSVDDFDYQTDSVFVRFKVSLVDGNKSRVPVPSTIIKWYNKMNKYAIDGVEVGKVAYDEENDTYSAIVKIPHPKMTEKQLWEFMEITVKMAIDPDDDGNYPIYKHVVFGEIIDINGMSADTPYSKEAAAKRAAYNIKGPHPKLIIQKEDEEVVAAREAIRNLELSMEKPDKLAAKALHKYHKAAAVGSTEKALAKAKAAWEKADAEAKAVEKTVFLEIVKLEKIIRDKSK